MRFAFALALTLTACGTPQTAEQACVELAAARCTRLGICSPDLMLTTFGDDATCQAREQLGCLSRLGAPGTAATPIFLAGCALAIPRISCRSFLTNALPLGCIAPPGRLGDGAACFDDAQCQSGTCNHATLYTCGTCGTPAVAGESCSVRSCARGLVCLRATCVRPGAVGDPCDDQTPCQVGGTCVGATPDMQGSCTEAVSMAGTACDPTGALLSDCNRPSKLYCQAGPGGGACQPITYLDAGSACNEADAASTCSAGARCESDVCVAPAVDGAPCDAAPCLAPAACIGGVCALPGAC